jgi:hypothetical protein
MGAEEAMKKGFVDEMLKRTDEEKEKDANDVGAKVVDCKEFINKFKNVPQKIAAMAKKPRLKFSIEETPGAIDEGNYVVGVADSASTSDGTIYVNLNGYLGEVTRLKNEIENLKNTIRIMSTI